MSTTVVETREKPVRTKPRSVGRWYIGESLGQGAYSWVKKGHDKKTGKHVALKFMTKANKSWIAEQQSQVMAEIEALTAVKHPNVLRLFAYNLEAKYPERDGSKSEVILLVLEYADGGELFDVLYYTSKLEPLIARTYFVQLINGLAACHAAGVAHRDIKPQNLLLDSQFNLKIADFGLAKLLTLPESDSDDSMSDCSSSPSLDSASPSLMHSFYVGTAGYQAPELLLRRPFGMGCDVFSAGVVLFVLLCGYPPFNSATESDKWYKNIATNRPSRFWERHYNCPIVQSDDTEVQDLLNRMLAFDPADRITIDEIKEHPFFRGPILSRKELVPALRARHREARQAKMQEAQQKQQQTVPERINRKRGLEIDRSFHSDDEDNGNDDDDDFHCDVPFAIPPRTVFDSSKHTVHLTDFVVTRPYEEIVSFIYADLSNQGARVELLDDESSTLRVVMRVRLADAPSSEFLLRMYVSFFERSRGRTMIRIRRGAGSSSVFNGVREMLEIKWGISLNV